MTSRTLLRCFVFVGGIVGLAPAGLAQNPALQLSSSGLTFTSIANGPKPPMQVVTITSVDGSSINFALLIDAGSPGTAAPSWLAVTPLLATTPVQMRVGIDQSGLAAGSYTARIQLTDRQGRPLGVIIPLTLQVTNGGAPQFDVTPTQLGFSGSVASANLQQGILVRSLGPGSIAPVNVSVISGYPWLSATVDPCDTVCTVNAKIAIATLTPGPHTGALRITTAIGSKEVPVSVFAADHGPYNQLSSDALEFEAAQGSALSDSRTLSILNTGDMPSTWSADVIAGVSWLSVSPSSGTTAPGKSTDLTAAINQGGMAAGSYGGLIRISSPDAGSIPIYLPVAFKVTASGTTPTPVLSAGGVMLTAQVGSADSVQQQLNLSAASASPVVFQASPQSASWLSLVPSRGQASNSSTPLTISASGINLAVGFYSGLVNLGFGTTGVRTLHVGFSITPATGASCVPQRLYLAETGIPDGFAARTGSPTPLEATLVDDCGNLVSNGAVTATFSTGDPGVELVEMGNGRYARTWTPLNSSESLPGGNVNIALRAYVPSLVPALSELVGTVTKDFFPAIAAGGVLNNLYPQVGAAIAPGAVVQIFGSALATGTGSGTMSNGRLSNVVGGVSVKIGGLDAPLYYASTGQINAQVPAELLANHQYQVIVNTNGVYSKPETINTISAQPGIAVFQDGKVIAQDVNYALINAQHPAHAGDIIVLYLSGMGATNPAVSTGSLAPASPLALTAIQPQVTIDGARADVIFAGLSPGSIGLYQIDVRVPAGVRSGDLPVIVTQGISVSNTALLPVR